MAIFNLGAGEPYSVPMLDPNYPADQTVTYVAGESKSAVFEAVIAKEGNPAEYSYQWYQNGVAIPGATKATYTKTGLTAGSYSLFCEVTNEAGTVTTRTASLTVTQYTTPVLDTAYPADQTVTYVAGESKSAVFEAKIKTDGNPAAYTYQWFENGEAVSGATQAVYVKEGLTAGNYSIYCEVSSEAGTVQTRTAALTVTQYITPVLNSSYPANVTQLEKSGGSATFKVEIATAGVPASYTYQWYVNWAAVSGATSASYTKTGLTAAATYTVFCKVSNAAGTVQSRTATLTVQSSQPVFTYSGTATLTKQNTYDWMLTLKTSGKLKFTHLGNCAGTVDVFLLGGGAGGGAYSEKYYGGGGGGGGKTTTAKKVAIKVNTEYDIQIGTGGGAATAGGTTTALGKSAAGGATRSSLGYGYGGSGGSGGGAGGYSSTKAGGAGGSDGGAGKTNTSATAGSGQGTTTRAFGETSGTLYAGGGGGGGGVNSSGTTTAAGAGGSGGGAAGNGKSASANTGGGGGGAKAASGTGGKGGSGIVLIRNAR